MTRKKIRKGGGQRKEERMKERKRERKKERKDMDVTWQGAIDQKLIGCFGDLF